MEMDDSTSKDPGMNPLDTQGLCLLSLDGGGVRGLSTLYILKDIMDRVNRELAKGPETPKRHVKPCELFDLIAGTSTGGLIAIMLGRLEMDVDECIREYESLMESIFGERGNRFPISFKTFKTQPRYKSEKLEKAIKDVLRKKGFGVNELMNNGEKGKCKTFVCTTMKEGCGVRLLRSYDSPEHEASAPKSVTVCQAALATSAATTFFAPVEIEGCQYVDGAFGANNPIEFVEKEARSLWTGSQIRSENNTLVEIPERLEDMVKCILSVGTGKPEQKVIEDNVFKFTKVLAKMATATDQAEHRFISRWSHHFKNGRLFRFNVTNGLQEVELHEHKKRPLITKVTHQYLQDTLLHPSFEGCASNLSLKQEKTSLRSLKMMKEFVALQAAKRTPQYNTIPLLRNPNFVGREEQLKKLDELLFREDVQARVAVYALGGAGKTQIALELAYRTLKKYPDCSVFWIPLISWDTIDEAYGEIARKLGIKSIRTSRQRSEMGQISQDGGKEGDRDPDAEMDVKVLVQRHLNEEFVGRWLLILDNVDDICLWQGKSDGSDGDIKQGIKKYLPTSTQGAVLLTTRHRKVASTLTKSNVLSLPPLDEATAIKLLKQTLPEDAKQTDDWDARAGELVRKLARIPLAISQAASFLTETGKSIPFYIDILDSESEADVVELLSEDFTDDGRYEGMSNPVALTWRISFLRIQRDDPHAANILKAVSLLDYKKIPRAILPVAESHLKQEKALATLTGYSFLIERGNGDFDMHRLVHLATVNWLQVSMESAADFLKWAVKAAGSFHFQIDADDWKSPHTSSKNRKYLPHWKRLVSLAPDLRTFERVKMEPSDYQGFLKLQKLYLAFLYDDYCIEEMASVCRVQYESSRAVLGIENFHTMDCSLLLLKSAREYPNKVALAVEDGTKMALELASCLAQKLKACNNDSEFQHRYYTTMQICVEYLLDESLDAGCTNLQEVESIVKQMLDHTNVEMPVEYFEEYHGQTADLLARVMILQGRHDDAVAVIREALAQISGKLGIKHLSSFAAVDHLATTITLTSLKTGAEMSLHEIRERFTTILGQHCDLIDHETENLLWGLALDYAQEICLFDQQQAEESFQRLWQQRKPGHDDSGKSTETLKTLVSLVENYVTQNSPEQVSEIQWKKTRTLATSIVQNNLRVKRAEECYQQLYEHKKKCYGEENPETMEILETLAFCYGKQRKFKQEEGCYRRLWESKKKLYGEEDHGTVEALRFLVASVRDQRRHNEAEVLARHLLQLQKKVYGLMHESTMETMSILYYLLLDPLGRYSEAIALLGPLRSFYGEDYGENGIFPGIYHPPPVITSFEYSDEYEDIEEDEDTIILEDYIEEETGARVRRGITRVHQGFDLRL
ncbi:hypothetical protein BJ508DRAFT_239903 [Ascobolus immersus RN42]|uniref:PNPLA domain-containing protein n=1 Tax=Ascobolus immersus RN42 TaxID=1160509 RepID=A0A3N4I789_ASCIM|nr:hypothetical protein BJ508DRAFT_239903 [Ascobolus immersus RN42]